MVFRAGSPNPERRKKSTDGRAAGETPEEFMLVKVTEVGGITKNNFGQVTRYYGTAKGDETVTDKTYVVFSRFGTASEGAWVLLIKVYGKWEILQAECNPSDVPERVTDEEGNDIDEEGNDI